VDEFLSAWLSEVLLPNYLTHHFPRTWSVVGQRIERKLAAILAADVAGYSRLMGADESGTLATLKNHRTEIIDPNLAEFRGRCCSHS
jgi:class 3 adenylate cyclase